MFVASLCLLRICVTISAMKPIDLTPPFTREQKQVAVHDHIWYVPKRPKIDTGFVFAGFSAPEFFGNNNPVHLEFCSGNGLWIFEKAKAYPEINWVAVELKFKRVRKIWSKIKNSQLGNLIVICGEAFHAIKTYLPDDCIDTAYINFPDPWPKQRHAKYRLVQLRFTQEVARVLKPGGEFNLVTDDEPYGYQMREEMGRTPGFYSEIATPHFTNERPDYGTSYFEDLWREKGKLIYYHCYRLGAIS